MDPGAFAELSGCASAHLSFFFVVDNAAR